MYHPLKDIHFIPVYAFDTTVPPEGNVVTRCQGSRNATSQRNQIRVLNKSNAQNKVESNPNLESYFGSPKQIKESHSNPITTYSSQTTPRIITPSSGTNNLSKSGSKEEPTIGSPSNESVVGSLPRTLSTSVLRIKHRRTFWERVVG